jgi:hypothetical protein
MKIYWPCSPGTARTTPGTKITLSNILAPRGDDLSGTQTYEGTAPNERTPCSDAGVVVTG